MLLNGTTALLFLSGLKPMCWPPLLVFPCSIVTKTTQVKIHQDTLIQEVPFFEGSSLLREGNGALLQYSCLENPMDGGAWQAAVHGVAKSQTQLSDFTFHFHALEKEMATHSSVLAWRITGTGRWAAIYGVADLDTTEATQQQQQQQPARAARSLAVEPHRFETRPWHVLSRHQCCVTLASGFTSLTLSLYI